MTTMTTTTSKPGYMSCPRNCGVDVREHRSSALVNGRCDVSLLAYPEQVAAVRELIQHARRHGAVHAIYSIGDGTGRSYGPREHTWDLGVARVAYDDGCLIYRRHGQRLLTVRQVTSVRQFADLLAAIGVLPFAFATAYRVGRSDAAFIANVDTNPDRKCRYCGATSGLKMLHRSPLALAADEWQCWDNCRDSAR